MIYKTKILVLVLLLSLSGAASIELDIFGFDSGPKPIKNCAQEIDNVCNKCIHGFALIDNKCTQPSIGPECTLETCGPISRVFFDEIVRQSKTMKSSGEYFYLVRGLDNSLDKNVLVIRAYPGSQAKYVTTIETNLEFGILQIHASDNYLYVIGGQQEPIVRYGIVFYTVVQVYDVTNKESPTLFTKYRLNGLYTGSKLNSNDFLTITALSRFSDREKPYYQPVNGEPWLVQKNFNIRKQHKHLTGVLGVYNGMRFSVMSIHKNKPNPEAVSIAQIQTDDFSFNILVIGSDGVYYTSNDDSACQLSKIIVFQDLIAPFNDSLLINGQRCNDLIEYDENMEAVNLITYNDLEFNSYYSWIDKNLAVLQKASLDGQATNLKSYGEKIYVKLEDGNNSLKIYDRTEDRELVFLGQVSLYGYSRFYWVYQPDIILAVKHVIQVQGKNTVGLRVSLINVSNPADAYEVSSQIIHFEPGFSYKFYEKASLFSRIKNILVLPVTYDNGLQFGFGAFYLYVDRQLVQLRKFIKLDDRAKNSEIIEELLYIQDACWINAFKIFDLESAAQVYMPC